MVGIKKLLHKLVPIVKRAIDNAKRDQYLWTDKSKKLQSIRNSAVRNRCFIIGNGPSLTLNDLESIREEDCFACNRIYGLYDETVWRPKFYCVQDKRVLKQICNDLRYATGQSEKSFLPYNYRNCYPQEVIEKEDVMLFYHPYVSVYSEDGNYSEGIIPFSSDITRGIYDGLSVIYGMIQIAVYMGYKEIYLVGMDHNYVMKDGKVDAERSYCKGIKPIDMANQYPPELTLCENAFRTAKRYCEEHGIIIKNATRGGKLEVFERVCLDDLTGGSC